MYLRGETKVLARGSDGGGWLNPGTVTQINCVYWWGRLRRRELNGWNVLMGNCNTVGFPGYP